MTCAGLGLLCHVSAWANDFPTSERVIYVQECIKANPGPHYEMISKCSCALDTLAAKVPYKTYVEMSTAANATTMGGERGSEIRDNPSLQQLIKTYKALQSQVKTSCFIGGIQ